MRTLSRFEDLADIEKVTVANIDGKPVRLGDVADGRPHPQGTHHRHPHRRPRERGDRRLQGGRRQHRGDGRARCAAIWTACAEQLPENMQLEVLFDQSVFIAQAVSEVRNNALLGGLLAVLVLFVFLRDFRSTLIIGIAIPISIVATFILMLTRGVSLNIMSLGGLALGVGMLVDNSIVVLEAIHRRREEAPAGADPAEIAARGAGEVAGAVTASTLTTLAVFVPIVFVVVGVAGQIFRDQALTVTFSLLVSLVVALTFTPMAAAFGQGAVGAAGGNPIKKSWYASWSVHAGEGRRVFRWIRIAGLFVTIGLPMLVIRLFRLMLAGLRLVALGLMWPLTWSFSLVFPPLQRGYARHQNEAGRIDINPHRIGVIIGFDRCPFLCSVVPIFYLCPSFGNKNQSESPCQWLQDTFRLTLGKKQKPDYCPHKTACSSVYDDIPYGPTFLKGRQPGMLPGHREYHPWRHPPSKASNHPFPLLSRPYWIDQTREYISTHPALNGNPPRWAAVLSPHLFWAVASLHSPHAEHLRNSS